MADKEKEKSNIEEQSADSKNLETNKSEDTPPEVKPKRKRNLKKILLYSVLGLVALFFLLSISLGMIIKVSVNQVAPSITGTKVHIGSCYLNIFSGALSVKDFVVGSPEGFQAENTFKLHEIYVDLDVASLFSDKIVVEKILVDGMDVTFEATMSGTNIGAIKENVDKATKGEKAEPEKQAEPETPAEGPETAEGKTASSKKLQIDDFKFINSHVILAAGGSDASVPLASIELSNIGDSKDGATVGEVSTKVMNALYVSIMKAVQNASGDSVKAGTSKAVEKVKEGTDAMVKGVKNLFGGDEK